MRNVQTLVYVNKNKVNKLQRTGNYIKITSLVI